MSQFPFDSVADADASDIVDKRLTVFLSVNYATWYWHAVEERRSLCEQTKTVGIKKLMACSHKKKCC